MANSGEDNSSEDVSFVDNCFSVLDNEDSASDEQEFETAYLDAHQILPAITDESLALKGVLMSDGRRDSLDLLGIQQLGNQQQAGYWAFNSLEKVANRDLWEYVCRNEKLKSTKPLPARRNTSSLTLDSDFETVNPAYSSTADQEKVGENWARQFNVDRKPRAVKGFEEKYVKGGEDDSYFVLDDTSDDQTIDKFERLMNAKFEEENDLPSILVSADFGRCFFKQLDYSGGTQTNEDSINDRTFLVESELSSIISGEKKDGEDMLSVFQRYLADPELKSVLLGHLFPFCKMLNDADKEHVAEKLGEFVVMDDESNSAFRSRVLLTDQLISMVQLFDTSKVNQFFSGFALAFSADRIADVRGMGVLLLADVIGIFVKAEWPDFVSKVTSSSPETAEMPLTTKIVSEVRKGFWNEKNWRTRQSFARLLTTMLKDKVIDSDVFCFLFCEDLIRVSQDAVPNVRQYFCAVGQLSRSCDYFKANSEDISSALKSRLKQMMEEDSDIEIRYQAKIALGDSDLDSVALSSSKE